ITIAPEKTALIVVDMQNFFLDSKCMDHPNGLKAVQPTIAVIEKCREVGIKVIWLNWGLTDQDMETLPAGVARGFMKDILLPSSSSSSKIRSYTGLGSDLGDGKGKCLFAGSWNADIYPPLKDMVKEEDLHCAKNRMSGMWSEEQPLYKTLKGKGVESVLFAGVNTDQCVGGTLVDAYNKGWDCVLVDDCCGTTTTGGGREVFCYNIATSYGFVTDSKSFVAA
ncbi:Isochorismatase hydrolase, partial [Mollisia scopiformis]